MEHCISREIWEWMYPTVRLSNSFWEFTSILGTLCKHLVGVRLSLPKANNGNNNKKQQIKAKLPVQNKQDDWNDNCFHNHITQSLNNICNQVPQDGQDKDLSDPHYLPPDYHVFSTAKSLLQCTHKQNFGKK